MRRCCEALLDGAADALGLSSGEEDELEQRAFLFVREALYGLDSLADMGVRTELKELRAKAVEFLAASPLPTVHDVLGPVLENIRHREYREAHDKLAAVRKADTAGTNAENLLAIEAYLLIQLRRFEDVPQVIGNLLAVSELLPNNLEINLQNLKNIREALLSTRLMWVSPFPQLSTQVQLIDRAIEDIESRRDGP
ncbi:hypothetical protein JGU71_29380 [Antrihabitans sp. YC3-6]|uniref:Uncharacterized protein n=1 Tax=Antrihabitans stalagmiti TaxID=2799499 RepID=A0A934NXD2_9NOCA|nr:hypothetical protein [Antrihabitans stalagmiti]MBJ8343002.1 hypothetical protein [Antrihabitans stalagmiti]